MSLFWNFGVIFNVFYWACYLKWSQTKFQAWVLTLLNSTISFVGGSYVVYCQLTGKDSTVVSEYINHSFLVYLVLDLIYGVWHYRDAMTIPGYMHHIIYWLHNYYAVLPRPNIRDVFSMYLVEELPFVYLSLCYLKKNWISKPLYFGLMVTFRCIYHLILTLFVWDQLSKANWGCILFSCCFQGYYLVTYFKHHIQTKKKDISSSSSSSSAEVAPVDDGDKSE